MTTEPRERRKGREYERREADQEESPHEVGRLGRQRLQPDGAFSGNARRQGWPKDEIKTVLDEAMAGDYNHLLRTLSANIDDDIDDEDEEDEDR